MPINNNSRAVFISITTVGLAFGLISLITQIDSSIFSSFFGFEKLFSYMQKQIVSNILLFYSVFLVVPFTLFLESIIPADAKQELWNRNIKQDLVWLFINKLFGSAVVVLYVGILSSFYESHLTPLTFNSLSDLPFIVRFIFGVLLVDFTNWFHHLVRHKVPWLWYFHAIHHSQKEMNIFTDFRVHFVDNIAAKTIVFIPLLMCSFEIPEVIIFHFLHMFYTRFYHGNVRTNLGPLKYFLVTPQSHRVHHSSLAQHMDKNFGVLFCIWDRLFGTHYDANDYPATGIHDKTFPHPQDDTIKEMLLTLIKQLFYPFHKIYQSISKYIFVRLNGKRSGKNEF